MPRKNASRMFSTKIARSAMPSRLTPSSGLPSCGTADNAQFKDAQSKEVRIVSEIIS